MKILTNLIMAAVAIGAAFLVAFTMDAAEFDWSSFGMPIVNVFGLDMYDDRVYLGFIFSFISVLSILFFGLFRASKSIIHAEEPIKALFAALSVSSFVFILLAWFDGGEGSLASVGVTALIAFLFLLFLFQFRGQDGFFGRVCTVIEIPVVFLTVLYAVLVAAVWLIGSLIMIPSLFDGGNWTGDAARPIYWATNAVVFGLGVFCCLGVLYIVGAKSLVADLLDVADADSLYDVIALPLVTLFMIAMNSNAFLSSVFNERFSGFF